MLGIAAAAATTAHHRPGYLGSPLQQLQQPLSELGKVDCGSCSFLCRALSPLARTAFPSRPCSPPLLSLLCVRAQRSPTISRAPFGVQAEVKMRSFAPVLSVLAGSALLGSPCGSFSSVAKTSPPLSFVPASPPLDPLEVQKLQDFVSRARRLFVLTGAGISTESGIPDYRSEGVGLYARTDRRPIQHAEFLRSARARQRYWARNFVGWPQFSAHQPNPAHLALREWETLGKLHWLVTQNVDALHAKAGSERLTELHGCIHRVLCLRCGDTTARAELQERFQALNPTWQEEAHGVAPDGDVFLTEEQVRSFLVPPCGKCGGDLKPDVTFFGDTVSKEKVDFVYQRLDESDSVLVAGSSLQVYSAYKFALGARDRKLPIAVLNIGPTRADDLASLRLSSRCGELLPLILPK